MFFFIFLAKGSFVTGFAVEGALAVGGVLAVCVFCVFVFRGVFGMLTMQEDWWCGKDVRGGLEL